MRWAAFSLRTPDDRPLIVDGTRGTQVAAMVRHAIHQSAKCLGLDAGLISELMGHGGDGRISVQPLPNVGYRHADGRIRRVLLVAPECVDGDAWRGVVSGLVGAALVAEAPGEAVGLLAPIAEPDPMLGRYRGEGRCLDERDPGGAAEVRQPAGPAASGALGAKAPSPRGHRGGARRAGGVRARVAASREHSPAVVPAPGAPRAVSVHAPQRRVDGPGPGPARAGRRRRVRARASGSGGRRIPRQ